MSTLIDVPITHVTQHPLNPRTKAVADPDMVSSVATSGILEPLILAPVDGKPDRYVLIAGHRRVDACKKAKVKTAPAVVRADLDTDALQLEAMLIENGHRYDLTPIEEAHAYQQLELFGYTAQSIASAVGRDVKTVRARKKLLKLSAGTQKKIAAGDVTLEDAAEMGKYAGDADAEKRLTRAAGTGSLRYQLAEEARRAKAARETAEKIAELLELGATEYTIPEGKSLYDIAQMGSWGTPQDVAVLAATFSTEPTDHAGCLAYTVADCYGVQSLHVLCTDTKSHREQLDDAKRQAAEETEQQAAADKARDVLEDAAADARISAVIEAVDENPPLSGHLADLARLLVPTLLTHMYPHNELERFQDLVDLSASQRWTHYSRGADAQLFADYVDDLAIATDRTITRALFAAMLASADHAFAVQWHDQMPIRRSYADLLAALGHPMTGEVDAELLANLNGDQVTDSDAEQVSA